MWKKFSERNLKKNSPKPRAENNGYFKTKLHRRAYTMILFSGQVEIDLKRIPKPYGRPKEIKDWPLSKETNSLFEKVRVRGWWPVAGKPKKKDKKKNKIAKSVERVLTVRFNLRQ